MTTAAAVVANISGVIPSPGSGAVTAEVLNSSGTALKVLDEAGGKLVLNPSPHIKTSFFRLLLI